MKVDDLTDPERKIWQAAATGTLADLQVGNPKLDSPEKGTEWGPERTVRAKVITALLIGEGDAASLVVRSVRLQGARIIGNLDLEAMTLRCPLALLDCSFDSSINLNEATALSVRLSGSQIPAVHARQLRARSDLLLDKGFSVSDGVELEAAHIGRTLICTDGQFSNPNGFALAADSLTVDGHLFCDGKFTGEVHLLGAHIKGQLVCTDGQFSNPNGFALTADGLTVDQDVFCNGKFSATGEVHLVGAYIKGIFSCTDGQFSNPNGLALNALGSTIDGHMLCNGKFSATGEVRLLSAHIGGQLSCRDGQFSNVGGLALNLEGSL